MKEEFSFLFEAIDQKLADPAKKSETGEPTLESSSNVNPEADSDEIGEGLMETDDEEDIESETNEDRLFIGDDVEDQGASFYQAVDREREELQEDEDSGEENVENRAEDNSPEPKKKKGQPLK